MEDMSRIGVSVGPQGIPKQDGADLRLNFEALLTAVHVLRESCTLKQKRILTYSDSVGLPSGGLVS